MAEPTLPLPAGCAEWDPEMVEWMLLSPAERWEISQHMWATFLALGGTFAPEPDPQSPCFDADEWRALSPDGRPGLRVIRRSGV